MSNTERQLAFGSSKAVSHSSSLTDRSIK